MNEKDDLNNNYLSEESPVSSINKKKKKKIVEEKKIKEKQVNDFEKFRISGRYQLLKYIGAGSFGEIHLAYDTHSKKTVCLKFELTNQKMPQLKHEYGVIESIHENEYQEGFPRVYTFEKDSKNYSYMVMDFLGPSLADLLNFCGGKFSLITTLLIGIQMITRIETLHEIGYLHRDLKPENFLIGLNETSHLVYLIDFGLAKRYKNINSTGQHIPYKENKTLVGTVRYASINSHLGVETSRRDDIESFLYILVYLYLGKLPWQNSQNNEDREMKKVVDKKIKVSPENLCDTMPKQFSNILHYSKNLKFEDRPDYNLIKNLLKEVFLSNFDYCKLDIFIPVQIVQENIVSLLNSSNKVKQSSSPSKYKKHKVSEFLSQLETNKHSFDINSNDLYTTSDPNIVYINKEFTFLYDWQINPNDKNYITTKYDKKFTIQSKIQEEDFSENQESDKLSHSVTEKESENSNSNSKNDKESETSMENINLKEILSNLQKKKDNSDEMENEFVIKKNN